MDFKPQFLKVSFYSGCSTLINISFISYIVFDADPHHNTLIYLRDGSCKTVVEQSLTYFADALDIKP